MRLAVLVLCSAGVSAGLVPANENRPAFAFGNTTTHQYSNLFNASRHSLQLTQVHTFPNLGEITALDAGHTHIYAATQNKVVKILRSTMQTVAEYNLADHGMRDATSVRIDEPHVFITVTQKVSATAGTGSDSAAGDILLLKMDHKLTQLNSFAFTNGDNVPFGMEIDNNFIYTGEYTLPGRVLKIYKSNLTLAARLELQDGENDIRQLESDPTDPNDRYIYANTNTDPGQIIKIEKANLNVVQRLTLNSADAYPLAGIELDKKYLYVGTNTQPGRVLKINKDQMAVEDEVVLPEGDNNIAALESDKEFLFVACYTKPGRVVRISKRNMQRMDHVELPSGVNELTALAHGAAHLYAATYTNPGKIVELWGYEQPVNCQVGDWGYWSTPTRDCGGEQTRTRMVIQPAFYGGRGCENEEMIETRNYTAPFCGMTCKGGKVFSKTASSCTRTCERPNPVCLTAGGANATQPGCMCPPDKPIEYLGVCTTLEWCPQAHMKPCDDLHCRYTDGRIKVHHVGEVYEKHFCRHSQELYGGCHCLCYHDQLQQPCTGTDASCGSTSRAWFEARESAHADELALAAQQSATTTIEDSSGSGSTEDSVLPAASTNVENIPVTNAEENV
jgi:hypothetical protein